MSRIQQAARQRGVHSRAGTVTEMRGSILAILRLAHAPVHLHTLRDTLVCCPASYRLFEEAEEQLERDGATVVFWNDCLVARLRQPGDPMGSPATPADWFRPLEERRRLALVPPQVGGEPPA